MAAENRSLYLTGLLACAMAIWTSSASPSSQTVSARALAEFPEAHYLQARESGQKILHVDSAQSFAVIEVHRAGPVAWLGHDHVVASHDLSGYVSPAEGLADLLVPLENLVLDEPELRTEAGFNTQPSQEDIEATRRNMLKETLDSQRFPYAYIHIDRVEGNSSALNVSIRLHGITRTYQVQAKIETVLSGIAVDGRMSFNQSDFGITPFSVLGGALQVQDRLDLRFHILAQKY
jgi:hypothetical protein